MIDSAEIECRLRPQPTTTEQDARIDVLRADYERLAARIVGLTPTRREQSLAITKLEESSFWAVKAIARGVQ